ncbi:MAG: hypothetical protein SWY16_13325 [Cyanobacteriota bacterium]|nr:hypothetical protein [Cyanobacteriota bacterium]
MATLTPTPCDKFLARAIDSRTHRPFPNPNTVACRMAAKRTHSLFPVPRSPFPTFTGNCLIIT